MMVAMYNPLSVRVMTCAVPYPVERSQAVGVGAPFASPARVSAKPVYGRLEDTQEAFISKDDKLCSFGTYIDHSPMGRQVIT